MEKVKLNSQRVATVAYDEKKRILRVWSSRGRLTRHSDISEGMYQNLISADPPDFYYSVYIHNGDLPRSRVWHSTIKLVSVLVLTIALVSVSASEIGQAATVAAIGTIG